jgi:transcriptional regulator with AAA-type ATPase domain
MIPAEKREKHTFIFLVNSFLKESGAALKYVIMKAQSRRCLVSSFEGRVKEFRNMISVYVSARVLL